MLLTLLGIDIAKLKFDVALLQGDQTLTQQFANSPAGYQQLQEWLTAQAITQVHACLEATGSYGLALALFLHQQGHLVSVVNPLRIKGYATAQLRRHKNDRADARLIADFCRTQNRSPVDSRRRQCAAFAGFNPPLRSTSSDAPSGTESLGGGRARRPTQPSADAGSTGRGNRPADGGN